MLFWKSVACCIQRIHSYVSILILLDVILEVAAFGERCKTKQLVSILILLDVILEDKSGTLDVIDELCFNPYSVGCYSGSATPLRLLSAVNRVSILILLDVILEVAL